MRRYVGFLVLTILFSLFFIACPNQSTTYKVSGSVSGTNWMMNNPVSVTLTKGSSTYSASVNLSNPGAIGLQSVSYSISDVPTGTYAVTVTIPNNVAGVGAFAPGSPAYTINGGSPIKVDSASDNGSGTSYTLVATIDSLTISGSKTINIDFGASM